MYDGYKMVIIMRLLPRSELTPTDDRRKRISSGFEWLTSWNVVHNSKNRYNDESRGIRKKFWNTDDFLNLDERWTNFGEEPLEEKFEIKKEETKLFYFFQQNRYE